MGDDYASVGERIAAIRKKRGLSRADLSRKTGISDALLYKYETGRTEHMYIDTVGKLCMALDVGLGDLMGWDEADETESETAFTREEDLKDMHLIPVYTKFAGDPPVPSGAAVGKVGVYDPTVKSADELIAIMVEDDRLLSEDIFPDDVLIIKIQDKVPVGRLVAVVINTEVEIRKLELERDGVMVYKLDSSEPPIKYDFQKMADKSIQIIGECVQIIRGAWYWKNQKTD